MKLSGELDYRIRYDIEHDLFHAQNVFNDEYITPTFVEYVQKLEEENAELKNKLEHRNCLDCSNHSSKLRMKTLELEKECTKAKEIIKEMLSILPKENIEGIYEITEEAEQFLSEVEK